MGLAVGKYSSESPPTGVLGTWVVIQRELVPCRGDSGDKAGGFEVLLSKLDGRTGEVGSPSDSWSSVVS